MDNNCLPVGHKGLMGVDKLAGEANGVLKLVELKNNHKVHKAMRKETQRRTECALREILVCFV